MVFSSCYGVMRRENKFGKISMNMLREKARDPGELKPRLELQAQRQEACIAVARVSSITAVHSWIDFGSLAAATVQRTCPIV